MDWRMRYVKQVETCEINRRRVSHSMPSALLTAPAELIRSTATTGHSSALRALGTTMNPLVEADRRQAFRLLNTALPGVMEAPQDAALRIDLCAAAFLQNRADDDDQGRRTHGGGTHGAKAADQPGARRADDDEVDEL